MGGNGATGQGRRRLRNRRGGTSGSVLNALGRLRGGRRVGTSTMNRALGNVNRRRRRQGRRPSRRTFR